MYGGVWRSETIYQISDSDHHHRTSHNRTLHTGVGGSFRFKLRLSRANLAGGSKGVGAALCVPQALFRLLDIDQVAQLHSKLVRGAQPDAHILA